MASDRTPREHWSHDEPLILDVQDFINPGDSDNPGLPPDSTAPQPLTGDLHAYRCENGHHITNAPVDYRTCNAVLPWPVRAESVPCGADIEYIGIQSYDALVAECDAMSRAVFWLSRPDRPDSAWPPHVLHGYDVAAKRRDRKAKNG